jgi:single-stranded-DNA-specific exonuclease
LLKTNSLILWNRQWHQGVLGIVASRMVEKYYRPVVLVAVKDQFGKGSARSIPEIDLYQRLSACESILENFGGHAMAAGLKVKIENLELFKKHFEDAVGKLIETQNLMPKLYIDGELDFSDISQRLIDELESLAPFGTGNPEPVFMARHVRVASSKVVGRNHRRMVLKQTFNASNQGFHAIHFNVHTGLPFKDSFERMAFKLRWNRWNATKTAQLIIEDVSI